MHFSYSFTLYKLDWIVSTFALIRRVFDAVGLAFLQHLFFGFYDATVLLGDVPVLLGDVMQSVA